MPLGRGFENCNPVAVGDIFNSVGCNPTNNARKMPDPEGVALNALEYDPFRVGICVMTLVVGRVPDAIKYVRCADYTESNHLSRYSLMNSTAE